MEATAITAIVVVGTIFLIIGHLGRVKSKRVQGFFLCEGNLKSAPFLGTLCMSNFSLGNMIFLSLIWGYLYGVSGVIWLSLGFALAAAVYVLFIKRFSAFREYMENRDNSGSIHEYLEQQFQRNRSDSTARKIRYLASAATILCLLIALTLEIYLASTILSPIIGQDSTTTFIVLTALICVYSSMGGFWAVIKTDALQGIMLILGVVAVGVIAYRLKLPPGEYWPAYDVNEVNLRTIVTHVLYAPGWKGIVSIIGVTFAWYLVSMDTWQRACATRSSSTVARGTIIATVILIVGIVVFCLIGMYDKLYILPSLTAANEGLHSAGYNPAKDLFLLGDQVSALGRGLLGFVAVAFLAAGLSTADTFLIVCGHSFTSDLMVRLNKGATFGALEESRSQLLAGIGRAAVVAMGLFVMFTFWVVKSIGLLDDPLALFYVAYSIQFSLMVPVFLSVRKTRTDPGTILVMIILSIVVCLVWGFGTAIGARHGFTGFWGLNAQEMIYFSPLPPMIVGLLVLGASRVVASLKN